MEIQKYIDSGDINHEDLVFYLLDNYYIINILEAFVKHLDHNPEHTDYKVFKAALEIELIFGGGGK